MPNTRSFTAQESATPQSTPRQQEANPFFPSAGQDINPANLGQLFPLLNEPAVWRQIHQLAETVLAKQPGMTAVSGAASINANPVEPMPTPISGSPDTTSPALANAQRPTRPHQQPKLTTAPVIGTDDSTPAVWPPSELPPSAKPDKPNKGSPKSTSAPQAIPTDWQPGTRVYAWADKQKMTRTWVDDQVDEFVMYWTDAGTKRRSWDATFIHRLQFLQTHQPAQPQEQSHAISQTGLNDKDDDEGATPWDQISWLNGADLPG